MNPKDSANGGNTPIITKFVDHYHSEYPAQAEFSPFLTNGGTNDGWDPGELGGFYVEVNYAPDEGTTFGY